MHTSIHTYIQGNYGFSGAFLYVIDAFQFTYKYGLLNGHTVYVSYTYSGTAPVFFSLCAKEVA